MLRPLHEVPAVRDKIHWRPPCVWADHVWLKYGEWDGHAQEPLVIFVLCDTCGCTPAEALSALPVRETPYAEHPAETVPDRP